MNRGKGRFIYGDATVKGIKVHSSVKTRLEVLDAKKKSVYQPKAFVRVGPREKQVLITDWNIEIPDKDSQWEWVH